MKRFLALLLSCAALLGGCGGSSPQDSGPITLSVWHVYGGQTDSPLNDLIARYNRTEGKEKGIQLVVTSVSNTNTIHEAVLASAGKEPGAPELPDLFIAYPKTIAALEDPGILVDYHDYFTDDELSAYLPEFIDEGVFDGRLLIFPLAKSTEPLFLNKTLFDRFAEETGASLDALSTWEGLFETAAAYAGWTDSLTPGVPGDGKAFFVHDYPFNYFQVGVQSLGEAFFEGEDFAYSPALKRVWEPIARAAIQGGVWWKEGYATDPIRTGEVISSVASSASILYYRDIVTYADNTSEPVEIVVLPAPRFEGGAELVMQRGAGFCAVSSAPERDRAACDFLRWITEPACNTEFVTSAGYLPVTTEAFESQLEPALEGLTEPKYKSLYETFMWMWPRYTFYTPPTMPRYLELESEFEYAFRTVVAGYRSEYLRLSAAGDHSEELVSRLCEESYGDFVASLKGEAVG